MSTPVHASALRDGGAGEGVDAVVQRVAAVAGDLVPRDVVALDLRQQGLPQVAVLHGLLLRIAPAVVPPAEIPLVPEAVHHVGTVAVDGDLAAVLERAQTLDRGHELHALVRGGGRAAEDLGLAAVLDQDDGPAAGTRVAAAGAVGVHRDGGGGGQESPLTLLSPQGGEGIEGVPLPGRERSEELRPTSRDSGRRTRRGGARSARAAPGAAAG